MNRNRNPRIGLVMKSLSAEFFQYMQKQAEMYAEERGDITLIPVGTQTQTEVELQIQLVEELIDQEIDALLIIPIDSCRLVKPVIRAVQAGVKVVNFDVRLDQDALQEQGISLAFLGPDNQQAAYQVGSVLAEKIGTSGKVFIIQGIPEAGNAQDRLAGFQQAAEEFQLEILASRSAYWETDRAYQLFQELYRDHPDVEGVMCANDAMAVGVIKALEELQVSGKMPVVGIDNDPSSASLLETGKLLATIDLQSALMVRAAIDRAVQSLEGKELTGWIKTPTLLVSA